MKNNGAGILIFISCLHVILTMKHCFGIVNVYGTTSLRHDDTRVPSGSYPTPPATTERQLHELTRQTGAPSPPGPVESSATVGPPSPPGPDENSATVGPPAPSGPDKSSATVGPPRPPGADENSATVGPPSPPGADENSATGGPPASPGFQGPDENSATAGPPGSLGSQGPDDNSATSTITNGQSSVSPTYYSSRFSTSPWYYAAVTDDPSKTTPGKPYYKGPEWMGNLLADDFSPIDFITSICPNTRFCKTSNISTAYEPWDTCCMRCECTDDCFVRGNCCHDKEIPEHFSGHEMPRSLLNESCAFPVYGYRSIGDLLHFEKRSRVIVASCPDKGRNFTLHDGRIPIQDLCEEPKLAGFLTIWDISPVFSHSAGVSYLNNFCAICNNDATSLLPWKEITLSCIDLSLFSWAFQARSSWKSFLETVSEMPCVLEFHPPNNNTVECLHQEAIISDCSDNSESGSKLRDLCENVTIPFGHGNKIYKNIFCYGCNEPAWSINEYSCQHNNNGYGYSYPYIEAELDVQAIEDGLINASEQYDRSNGTDARCEKDFVYNQHIGQCIAYVCAPSKVKVNGTCTSILTSLKNIGLDYKVTYEFLIGSVSSSKYWFEEMTKTAVRGNNTSISFCRHATETTASLSNYHVTHATLVTSVHSDMVNIEEEYMKFREKLAEVMDPLSIIETEVGDEHGGYEMLSFGPFGLVRYLGGSHFCPQTIAMVDLQFCDAVMFRIKWGQGDQKGYLLVKSIKFKPSDYLLRPKEENNTVSMYAHVCKDLFLEKVSALQNKNSTSNDVVSTSTCGEPRISFIISLAIACLSFIKRLY